MTEILVSLIKARSAESRAASLAIFLTPAGTPERRDALARSAQSADALRAAWRALWDLNPLEAARLSDKLHPLNP